MNDLILLQTEVIESLAKINRETIELLKQFIDVSDYEKILNETLSRV